MKKTNWTIWALVIIGAIALGEAAYIFKDYIPKKNTTVKVEENLDSLPLESPIPLPKDTTPYERLNFFIDSLCESKELHNASWGFYLYSIDSNRPVANFNENQSVVPASVMKAVTTGVALDMLGANYHFTTRLQYQGKLNKATRTLDGDIIIKGGGDPTLGSSFFGGCSPNIIMSKWLTAIKKLGIDTIKGRIIADARLFEFDMVPAGWAWEDMQSDYCAGPSGLSFAENMCNITAWGFADSMRVKTSPEVPGLALYNQVVISSSEPTAYAYVTGSPYMNERFIRGSVPSAGSQLKIQGQIPDPGFLCAYTLFKTLKRSGVVVTDSVTTMRKLKMEGRYKQPDIDPITFSSHYSPPLHSIVNHTNHVSQNFYAETLLKMIAVKANGHGTSYGGAMAVRNYMASKGIDVSGLYQVDGSGVSRYNAITPRQLTELLVHFATDSNFVFETYYNSLPIAGQSGTLSKLCKGTCAEKNIHAKSGYMSRVRSYAGYVKDTKGELMAFTMMSNNHGVNAIEMRDRWEHLMVLVAELD